MRYKVRHARLLPGENGTKFAMHAKNVPKRAILGQQGEFCTAHAVRRGLQGEFYTGSGAVRLVLGEFYTGSGPALFLVGDFFVTSVPSVSPVGVLPPPTGTAAWPSSPPSALHTCGAWCAVMARPVSASHAVQSSPCSAFSWRKRYKVRHACEKRAKKGHFERAGRVLYRACGEKRSTG